jgi:hypothetical protein
MKKKERSLEMVPHRQTIRKKAAKQTHEPKSKTVLRCPAGKSDGYTGSDGKQEDWKELYPSEDSNDKQNEVAAKNINLLNFRIMPTYQKSIACMCNSFLCCFMQFCSNVFGIYHTCSTVRFY